MTKKYTDPIYTHTHTYMQLESQSHTVCTLSYIRVLYRIQYPIDQGIVCPLQAVLEKSMLPEVEQNELAVLFPRAPVNLVYFRVIRSFLD